MTPEERLHEKLELEEYKEAALNLKDQRDAMVGQIISMTDTIADLRAEVKEWKSGLKARKAFQMLEAELSLAHDTRYEEREAFVAKLRALADSINNRG